MPSLTSTWSTAPLTVDLSYTCSGGGISASSDSVPALGVAYPLVTYRGTLSSHPAFTFDGPLAPGMVATVDYGSGTNSQISVTFSNDPYPAWAASHGLSGADALPTADPDGDAVANREEMLLGFDPVDPMSRLRLSVVAMDGATVTLRLNRVVTGGTFSLESSATLQAPWASTPITVPAEADDFEFLAPRSGSTRFFRAVFQAP